MKKRLNMVPGNDIDHLWTTTSFEIVDQYVEKFLKWQRTDNPLHVVCTSFSWVHAQPTDAVNYMVQQFHKHNIKVIIWTDTWHCNLVEKLKTINCDVKVLDYILWRVYREVVVLGASGINEHWNSLSDKFLFLTGKPNKPNRARLLWKLYKNDLLEHCTWSLFINDLNKQSTHTVLPELTEQEFDNFVTRFNRNPDSIEVIQKPHMDLHYGGIPYDHTLFQHTRFRLIAETGMGMTTPHITEKTWITILNKQPFIMAGDLGCCRLMQQMGFRTFNEYLKIPEYDLIEDHEQRLDAIVENTKHFLQDNTNQDLISCDVTHNYNRFLELGKQNQSCVDEFFDSAGVPLEQRDMYIYSADIIQYEHKFGNDYSKLGKKI